MLRADRKQESLDAAVAESPVGSATAMACEAHDPAHRAGVFDRAAAEFGGLDIFIANAGINPLYRPLVDLDLDGARRTLEVNVRATLTCAGIAGCRVSSRPTTRRPVSEEITRPSA
ncbi:MAG: SDR family oxidoreductase [Leucobacter sp.]